MQDADSSLTGICPTGLRTFNVAGQVVRLGCGRWSCPVCCIFNSWMRAKQVRYGLALWNGDKRHWVITMHPNIKTSAQGFWVLPKAWDNLRKSIQRDIGEWHYAAFVELHPKRAGIAHVHVVSLQRPNRRIKDLAAYAGFGYIDSDDEITGEDAARYVAKYTSKQGAQMPKNFRRVRFSHGWPSLPDPQPEISLVLPNKREPFADYVHRVSICTGIFPADLRLAWEHSELDIG